MLNTLLSQLVKNVRTLPGWVPLLVICYAASHLLDVGYIEDSAIAKLVRDTATLLVAFLAYQLGDAIDKALFGKFAKSRLDTSRSSARRTLNIQEGIYDVSKALADAGGMYTGSSIQVLNEGAKLVRSIAVVLIPLGVATLIFAEYLLGIVSLITGIVFLPISFYMKASHIKRLYILLKRLTKSDKYVSHLLGGDIRLFFWDGTLIGSAKNSADS